MTNPYTTFDNSSSAVGDLLERDDLVAIGQIEAGEDLVAVAAQARLDVAAGMAR